MQEPNSFVAFPRFIASDVKGGKMSHSEFRLYAWIRINADMYGKASVTLSGLKEDVFERQTVNYVNKLLLSLRSKNYLSFENRRGKSGTFEVKLNDWLGKGGYTRVSENNPNSPSGFNSKDKKSSVADKSQVGQDSGVVNQKLAIERTQLIQQLSSTSTQRPITPSYNETKTNTEKESTLQKATNFDGVDVRSFRPSNREEALCKEIAQAVGERFMNPLLSVLRKPNGFTVIETAWGIYRENQGKVEHMYNRAAYLNGIIKNLLK